MKKFILVALMSLCVTGALAHSKVDKTTPTDGDVLGEAPADIGFNFSKDIRLTRVEMTYQSDAAVRLELGEQTTFEREFVVPLQEMGEGSYRIDWRGLGADGHAMKGMFTFVVE